MNGRKHRLLLALLLLLIGAPLLFANGQQEKAKESPTLTWFTSVQGGRDPAEDPLFAEEVAKQTGVKVKLVKTTEDYTTKLSALLASGEPLDIVYMDSGIFERLWEQQLFEPLTRRISQSKILSDTGVIPKSEWDRIRRQDGEIYAVYNKFEQGTLPIVRMDWVEKLGLNKAPKNFDEYYELLKAFKTRDPDGNGKDDTYGMAIGYTNYELTGLFGAYGLAYGFVKDASGKLVAPWATEKATPVYEFLKKLYQEGILEPNFVTNNSGNFRELFMTDKAGMTFYWAAWVGLFNQQVKAKNPNSPFKARGIAPPAGPGGQALRNGTDGLMVVPKYSKNKDLAFKVIEFWHSRQGNMLSTLGIPDYDYKMVDGKPVLTDIGAKHAKDHGAPQPKSLKWVNPLGELEGFDDAAALVRKYGKTDLVTPYNSQWETITRSEGARIILGEISIKEGLANMERRFKEEKVYQ